MKECCRWLESWERAIQSIHFKVGAVIEAPFEYRKISIYLQNIIIYNYVYIWIYTYNHFEKKHSHTFRSHKGHGKSTVNKRCTQWGIPKYVGFRLSNHSQVIPKSMTWIISFALLQQHTAVTHKRFSATSAGDNQSWCLSCVGGERWRIWGEIANLRWKSSTHPKTNIGPGTLGWKMSFLLGRLNLRCYVCLAFFLRPSLQVCSRLHGEL